MRALVFFSVIALVNYYVSSRLFYYSPFHQLSALWPLLFTAVLIGLEMLDLRGGVFSSYPLLKLALTTVTGAVLCLLFYLFIADIALLVSMAALPSVDMDSLRKIIFASVLGVTFLTLVIGIWQAYQGPVVKHVTVKIRNLPASFEGYKILQISDLHIGNTIGDKYVSNVVRMANEQNADMVALTGDFADGTVAQLGHISTRLKDIRSRDGSFFITGNHEYFHDLPDWLVLYKKLGFHILMNSHKVIARGEDKLVIAGVTDYSTRHSDMPYRTDVAKAAAGMPQDAVSVLLMHQANLYKDAQKAGFDLQLSGHTHGGQFFPWTLVIPFFHHYHRGLSTFRDLQIYVNVGTGYWGPALRTFNPAEMTVLTLVKE